MKTENGRDNNLRRRLARMEPKQSLFINHGVEIIMIGKHVLIKINIRQWFILYCSKLFKLTLYGNHRGSALTRICIPFN